MVTIHAQWIGDKALVPREELERLVRQAEQSGPVVVEADEDDVPTIGIARLAEQGGAFDFWREEGEDIYSAEDGEPL